MSSINETKQNTAEVEAVTRAKMAEKNDADVKQGSSAKKFLMAILVIAIIVALALLVINAIIDSYANAFAEVDIDNAQATVDTLENMDVYEAMLGKSDAYTAALENHAYSSENVVSKDGVFTFSLFSVTEENSVGRIIVASLNKNTRKVSYVTVDASTAVYIPSADKVGPLSDAYLWGGAPLLARTIQSNYGVKIDAYVKVDYTALADVVDSMGGITVDGNAVAGNAIVDFVRNYEGDKNEAVEKISKASIEKVFSNGIGGIVNLLNSAKDSKGFEASIAREDFGTLVQLGFGAAGSTENSASVGVTTKKLLVIGATTCDYVAERTTMVDTLFGANK